MPRKYSPVGSNLHRCILGGLVRLKRESVDECIGSAYNCHGGQGRVAFGLGVNFPAAIGQRNGEAAAAIDLTGVINPVDCENIGDDRHTRNRVLEREPEHSGVAGLLGTRGAAQQQEL